jgi:hypothetical protein
MEVTDYKRKKQGFGFIFGGGYSRDSQRRHIDTADGKGNN